MVERIYCIQLVAGSNLTASLEVIRIRADYMNQVDTHLYEFKRGNCVVGRVESPILAWWIEEIGN